jgi:heme-degrading monooxygenase HmoA
MIAVIFEVMPAEGKWDEYLNLAAQLRPELDEIDGFISVERFQSIADPKKILSLSFWDNEESIKQWRNVEMHRLAQAEGRKSIFEDYRIRIANVTRDYTLENRAQAPDDSKIFHQ